MFFRDYVKNTITYDAAQFAIAIALDNLMMWMQLNQF